MATAKKRLNISMSKELEEALAFLARRDKTPQATKATALLETALEIEEDKLWESIAKKRDTKNAKFVSHETAWE